MSRRNPYRPGFEAEGHEPEVLPRYVPIDDLMNQHVRGLLAVLRDPRQQNKHLTARRTLKTEDIVAWGRDAYTDDEFAQLEPELQELIHEIEPSKSRIAGIVRELDDRYSTAQMRQFSDEVAQQDFEQRRVDLNRLIHQWGLNLDDYTTAFVDRDEVWDQLSNIVHDDDLWTRTEEGGDWRYVADEPITIHDVIEIWAALPQTLVDELQAALERAENPMFHDIDARALVNVTHLGIPLPPVEYYWSIDRNEAVRQLAQWAAEQAVPEVQDRFGEREDISAADAADAEAEAERRRAEQSAAALAAAEARARDRVLAYVRTGRPWEERIRYQFDDGTYVVELDSVSELQLETQYLRHCIGKHGDAGHGWPENFAEGEVRIFSMRPPGYDRMGKRRKARAPFVTIAVWPKGRGRLIATDIYGYDNRPVGRPQLKGRAVSRPVSVDEVQKLAEWWVLGEQQNLHDLRGRYPAVLTEALAVVTGQHMDDANELRETSTSRELFDELMELSPGIAAREYLPKGVDNPPRHHRCNAEGFCARPEPPSAALAPVRLRRRAGRR